MKHLRLLALLAATLLAVPFGATAATADVENDNLPAGTPISVEIATPADGALIGSPPGDVSLTGSASVGQGVPVANTTIIYVLDVSGSTAQGPGCGGDQNNDGNANFILDCEIAAIEALNQVAIANGTVDEVGMVVFASSAATGDVSPAAGVQALTAPATDANAAGGPDIEEVASSAFSTFGGNGGLNQFTFRNVGITTNFEAAVQSACSLVQQSTNPNNLVVFLSDGTATAGGNAVNDLPCAPTTATFQTFAIGSGSSCTNTGTSGQGSLQQIAQATGGTCTQVANVADLPNVVPGVIDSELTQLLLTVDGGAPIDISASATPALPVSGPAAVTYSTTVPGLAPGNHVLCVTAVGSDGGGQGSVTDCHTVTVADISLAPPMATNELGTPGQTHEVTATVAAGADGGVADVAVTFSITGGPNADEPGAVANTDTNGQATFSYDANQGPAGLGQDTIQACFTDSQGTTNCATATKDWVDTTPPQVACPATTNPAGKTVPAAGNNPKSGQNPDGFYELTATDAVDPNPQIFVVDTGSGTVFGPFPSGTRIKYTEDATATPEQKGMGGPNSAVTIHIIGTGDAAVHAVDASGNQSAPIACLVPGPPK